MACRIFSRAGESEYRWLLDILKKKCSVSPFVITNRNYSSFCEEIYKCSFAILYHSQSRGRVNITDVTDSLYDHEVKTMYEVLGKDRVIIVIDDLDDSSDDTKNRILTHQPTLKSLTRDIFLFTTRDKANTEVLHHKMQPIIYIISISVKMPHIEVQTDVHFPENVPEEVRPEMKGNTKKIVVSLLSCLVFWNTYYFAGRGNALVSLLWVAAMGRVFHNPRSAVLPLATQGRFILSCSLTLLTVYDVYHRPSIFNVATSALWISSCFMYSFPRGQRPLILQGGPMEMMISYGPVLLSFWQGWQQKDAETAFQMISWFLFRSPMILAAEGI